MRREIKFLKILAIAAGVLLPVASLAQDEGPIFPEIPNPMSVHTWFIIAAFGAFLAWCISYILELQKEKLQRLPERSGLLSQKEQALDQLAELESRKESGEITEERYEREFKKAKARLGEILERLKGGPDSSVEP